MRRCRPLLGTYVEIDADSADAIEAGYAAIARVHALMSAHEPDSDVGRINRFGHLGPVEVHGWTICVLERALVWSRRSAGAFDVVRAGKSAVERRLMPLHLDQPAPEATHWTWLQVQGRAVRLMRPGCVDLGGIAKGFAVDQAVAAMRRAGAAQGLVNAGGDVAAFGCRRWPVTVVHPLTREPLVEVELREEALATSAVHTDGAKDHLAAGSDWISVTARARKACDADALTKIVWAGAPKLDEILNHCGAAAFGVSADGVIESIGPDRLAA